MAKTALITGANKGIGFYTAKKFLAEGWNVILTGRSEERLQAAVRKLGSSQVRHLVWDIADIRSGERVLEQAHAFFGDISVFVNSAGIVTHRNFEEFCGFLGETPESFDETMGINLRGTYFALQAQAHYMLRKEIKGNIVAICSQNGFLASGDAYGVSKWGVRGMILGAARELGSKGIVVNGVAPGPTSTEIMRTAEAVPVQDDSIRGCYGMPDEVADEIYFLANSRNMIGTILQSDGGRTLYR